MPLFSLLFAPERLFQLSLAYDSYPGSTVGSIVCFSFSLLVEWICAQGEKEGMLTVATQVVHGTNGETGSNLGDRRVFYMRRPFVCDG